MRQVGAVALRLLALVACYGAGLLLSAVTGDGLGAGLLAFLAFVLVAVVWAFLDARRAGFLPAVVRWCVVAALLAPVMSLGVQSGSLDFEGGLAGLATFVPFLLALIGIPATLSAAAGAALRPGTRPRDAT